MKVIIIDTEGNFFKFTIRFINIIKILFISNIKLKDLGEWTKMSIMIPEFSCLVYY